MKIISHTGIGKRKENQDVILTEELYSETSLCLIVDGMGGYENGKVIAEKIASSIFNNLNNISLIDSTKIDEAIKKTNLEVKIYNEKENSKSGATIGGAIVFKNKINLFWVGDVSIHLFKEKEIIFKSKSHTLINDMLNNKNILSNQTIEKYKHIVTNSISGKREIIEKGFFEFGNNEFDSILICSDGVLDTITPLNFINDTLENINVNLLKKAVDNYSYIIINNTI